MHTDFQVHTIDVNNNLQNYIWLLEHIPTSRVAVVDPTDGILVQKYCQRHQLEIDQIWLTHWHKDHIGGVPDLLAEHSIPVYGPRDELSKIPFISHPLTHKNHFNFAGLNIKIIAVPGHTLGHIVYYAQEASILFCGDTLFAMGCGRVFEGTYTQMFNSLKKIAALAPETQVYCTHEYTQSNAAFAQHVEPENLDIQQRTYDIQKQRAMQQCTLPSNIALELKTNPFLRVTNVSEFQRLREMKDQF